jgi:hypothetical protein
MDENQGAIPGKISSRKSWLVFSLSKPKIVELPQPIEPNETMSRVTSSRWFGVTCSKCKLLHHLDLFNSTYYP